MLQNLQPSNLGVSGSKPGEAPAAIAEEARRGASIDRLGTSIPAGRVPTAPAVRFAAVLEPIVHAAAGLAPGGERLEMHAALQAGPEQASLEPLDGDSESNLEQTLTPHSSSFIDVSRDAPATPQSQDPVAVSAGSGREPDVVANPATSSSGPPTFSDLAARVAAARIALEQPRNAAASLATASTSPAIVDASMLGDETQAPLPGGNPSPPSGNSSPSHARVDTRAEHNLATARELGAAAPHGGDTRPMAPLGDTGSHMAATIQVEPNPRPASVSTQPTDVPKPTQSASSQSQDLPPSSSSRSAEIASAPTSSGRSADLLPSQSETAAADNTVERTASRTNATPIESKHGARPSEVNATVTTQPAVTEPRTSPEVVDETGPSERSSDPGRGTGPTSREPVLGTQEPRTDQQGLTAAAAKTSDAADGTSTRAAQLGDRGMTHAHAPVPARSSPTPSQGAPLQLALDAASTDTLSAQLSQRLVALAANGVHRARIALHPAELGTIEIRISLRDEAAAVSISTQHAHARELIESGLPRLRDLFASQGLNLADVDVSDRGQGSGSSRAETSEHAEASTAPTARVVAPPTAPRLTSEHESARLLDVLA